MKDVKAGEDLEQLKDSQFFWDENHPWDRTGHRSVLGWRGWLALQASRQMIQLLGHSRQASLTCMLMLALPLAIPAAGRWLSC
jgi:hypothetical protein